MVDKIKMTDFLRPEKVIKARQGLWWLANEEDSPPMKHRLEKRNIPLSLIDDLCLYYLYNENLSPAGEEMIQNTQRLYVLQEEGEVGQYVKGTQGKSTRFFTDKLESAMQITPEHAVTLVQEYYRGAGHAPLKLVEIQKGPRWVVVE